MELRTDRLLLRHWKPEDAAQLYELAKVPEIGEAAGWPPHNSVSMSEEVINTIFNGEYIFAILLRGTDTIIGCVGLSYDSRCPIDKNEMILGYWIGIPYQNKGYVTEACQALIDKVFAETTLKGIWCGNFIGNTKSSNVQRKLGFGNPIMDVAKNWGMDSDEPVENRYLPNQNYNKK